MCSDCYLQNLFKDCVCARMCMCFCCCEDDLVLGSFFPLVQKQVWSGAKQSIWKELRPLSGRAQHPDHGRGKGVWGRCVTLCRNLQPIRKWHDIYRCERPRYEFIRNKKYPHVWVKATAYIISSEWTYVGKMCLVLIIVIENGQLFHSSVGQGTKFQ